MNLTLTKFLFVLPMMVILAAATSAAPVAPASEDDPPREPFRMLVLGDSVVWGQGLDKHEKFSYLIKEDIERLLQRTVYVENFSHSGATIKRRYEESLVANEEVPIPSPTIWKQFESSIPKYKCIERAGDNHRKSDKRFVCPEVDLVLLNGCINDVALERILNPALRETKIDKLSKRFCFRAMSKLLREISATFVNAKIIVTGYFPIIGRGANSTPPSTISDLARAFLTKGSLPKVPRRYRIDPSSWIVHRLGGLSHAWAAASNRDLEKSVRMVNETSPNVRAHFVRVEFAPAETYAASDTKLWRIIGFDSKRNPITNDRKLVERINDHCPKSNTDLDDVKMKSWFRLMLKSICQPAGAGHPNKEGALKYRSAIWRVLRPALLESKTH